MTKVANRSRRLAAKLKEILLGIQNRQSQIEAVMANDELDSEQKEAIVEKIRLRIGQDHAAANRMQARKQELAYEDTRPVQSAPRARGFISHSDVLVDSGRDTKWTRLSRRECKCSRAFFAVQEAYGCR